MDPKEASESVAEKFTRVMNATPSPLGAWTDLGAASILSGILLLAGLFAVRQSSSTGSLYLALAIAAIPITASLLLSATLRRSRATVVAWLASVPFPIENVNAVLAGLGDTIEVVFEPGTPLPTRPSLQPKLDEISDDVLFVSARPDERIVELRLGIIDSKYMPLRTSHSRWIRLVEVVERGLVPLSKTSPIEKVHVV